jgi:succinate dehydrogenase / fumarate reductase iron-sulfur subunit
MMMWWWIPVSDFSGKKNFRWKNPPPDPVSGESRDFLGPAALLRAFRYLFDSRDAADGMRMEEQDYENGIWGCKTHGRCTEVCPKEIPVTRSLAVIKLKIKGKV